MESELRDYQLNCFFSPILDEKELSSTTDKIKKWLSGHEGKASDEKIARKYLGYKINNFQDAFHWQAYIKLGPNKISDLHKVLKQESDILRCMVTSFSPSSGITASKKSAATKFAKSLKDHKAEFTHKPEIEKDIEDKQQGDNEQKVDLTDLDKKLDEILSE